MDQKIQNTGDNDITSSSIQRNYIEGFDKAGSGSPQVTHGLFVGFQIDVEMRYNFVWGSGYGVVLKGSTGTVYTSKGCTYNVILESARGIYLKGVQSVVVSNNTIINKTIDFTWGINMAVNSGSDESSNCVIKNNIIIALGTGTNYMIKDEGTNNDIDFNIYYCPNGTPLWGGLSWANWQAAGNDLNSIVLTDEQFNNLFTDFDNNDFSLTTGSVAIGNGVDLGVNYNDGLDESTNWGDVNTVAYCHN